MQAPVFFSKRQYSFQIFGMNVAQTKRNFATLAPMSAFNTPAQNDNNSFGSTNRRLGKAACL